MYGKQPPTPKGGQSELLAGVQRLELLSWRFSEAEIQRLSTLQVRHREHPELVDLPVEERRLQFARWLVEHGRLSEDDGSGILDHPYSQANVPSAFQLGAAWELNGDGRRDLQGAGLKHSAAGKCLDAEQCRAPCPASARMKEQVRRLWGAICKVATWLLVPEDPWGRCYDGPYPSPYPQDRPRTPFNDPRLWRHS